jgi:hypothetical protein
MKIQTTSFPIDGTVARSDVASKAISPPRRGQHDLDARLAQLSSEMEKRHMLGWTQSDFGEVACDVCQADLLIKKDQLAPGCPPMDIQMDPLGDVRHFLEHPPSLNLPPAEKDALLEAADKMRQLVLDSGHPLSRPQLEIARRAGVLHPERVRYVCMSPTEFQRIFPPKLEELMGLPASTFLGLTLGPDAIIFVGEGSVDSDVLAHELRHVRQAEAAHDSGSNFVNAVLAELQRSGYERSAFEVDAYAYQDDPRMIDGLPATFELPSVSRL